MAKRVYYGTCATAAGTTAKKVYIPDMDLAERDFNFEKGDLLVVFFAQTNTANSPSITVYLQDTEHETSTVIDSGKLIKSLDIESNMARAWAAGETVIFAYTQKSTTDTYYWELIDGAHATTTVYGDTKLFDDSRFTTWIGQPEADVDSQIALTPNTLKKFFELLKTQAEDESEEEVEVPLGLKWTPYESGTAQKLGTLSLSNNTKGVVLTYPVEAKIAQYLNNNPPITHTGQLVNNGNGLTEDATSSDAEPFITRVIPNHLYFASGRSLRYGTPESSKARIILNNSNNRLVIGDSSDDTLVGISIGKPTNISGNTKITGKLTATVDAATSIGITTNGVVQEKGVNLSDRYSPQLQVIKYNHQTGKILKSGVSKQGDSAHIHIPLNDQTGWTAVGIVGYDINYLYQDHQDAYLANMWECFIRVINGVPNIEYSLYNLANRDIYVQVDFYVLFKKDI